MDSDVIAVPAQCAVQGFHDGVIVHPTDDHACCIRAVHVQGFGHIAKIVGDNKSVYFHGARICDVHYRCNRMRAIIGRGNPEVNGDIKIGTHAAETIAIGACDIDFGPNN